MIKKNILVSEIGNELDNAIKNNLKSVLIVGVSGIGETKAVRRWVINSPYTEFDQNVVPGLYERGENGVLRRELINGREVHALEIDLANRVNDGNTVWVVDYIIGKEDLNLDAEDNSYDWLYDLASTREYVSGVTVDKKIIKKKLNNLLLLVGITYYDGGMNEIHYDSFDEVLLVR